MSLESRLPFVSLSAICLITVAFGATLPDNEVEALKDIAKALGKRDWNFSVDPCSGKEGWVKGLDNIVTCGNCSSDATICHVVSIRLKSENLPGVVPPEMARLPFLQEIDLSRNYLNGTLSPEWSSLPLVNISLVVNRITGPIPKAYANITTLTSFAVDFNQLSGVLPAELGTLPNIQRLLLTSNNFTGELPATFANLTSLTDFRISDNHFTGQIPNYIQNWASLEKLVIQASGLVGPIPSGMSALENLTDLRITDLNASETSFPPLGNMKNMKTLILRSCNISGELPDYLVLMTNLKVLDLSFNKLSGTIPSTFDVLSGVEYIYLTGNMLSGTVPNWMLDKGKNIDLSYNNFTTATPEPNCQHRSVNLFASSSQANSSTGIGSCLRSSQCTKTDYYLHINCGGKRVFVNETTSFEEDIDGAGASTFVSKSNWGFSSTGHFLDDGITADSYIATNVSELFMNDSQLYMAARLSPISLTYYGFCLGSGNYTVSLHFAEIMFTDDNTYSSLGRRIFDVYVQGKRVLTDFNIEDKAGGIGKATVQRFPVTVTNNNTLEIHLYWAGKGTTGVPARGVYGPLISAISVDPDGFIPPSENGSSSTISVGTVLGITAAAVFVIILIVGILRWRGCFRPKNTLEQELKGRDLHTASFPLRQIKAATNNFDDANKIGEGGFGPVYKGILADGKVIAIKQLSSKSNQGNREFLNEVGIISTLQHPNLVKLYGCSIEGDQLLLIYEYMENNSLARALFGPKEHRLKLDWPTRHKICVGIARGLAYLHEESRLKIVHRDIKATNVLLDKDLNAKISDFGLAKLDEEDATHISTRIAGTYGYMAPEYAMRGYLTDKADVYSFGIVTLEIVCGRSNSSSRPKEDSFYLLDWANMLKGKGNLMELVDPNLGSNFDEEQAMVMINVALLCTDVSPTARPSMSSVVSMLEGRVDVQEFVPGPRVSNIDETKSEALRKYYQFSTEDHTTSTNQTQSMSIDVPFTASSSSAADLYPVNLASDYWKGRD